MAEPCKSWWVFLECTTFKKGFCWCSEDQSDILSFWECGCGWIFDSDSCGNGMDIGTGRWKQTINNSCHIANHKIYNTLHLHCIVRCQHFVLAHDRKRNAWEALYQLNNLITKLHAAKTSRVTFRGAHVGLIPNLEKLKRLTYFGMPDKQLNQADFHTKKSSCFHFKDHTCL